MGSKYVPTAKDFKANQRFRDQQLRSARAQNPAKIQPARSDSSKKRAK
jgi:hypothetical protein